MNALGGISQVFQSVLTNQPIRTGQLFESKKIVDCDGKQLTKPKLGRMISSIRVKAHIHPLILGLMGETEDLVGTVGVRGRSEEMIVDLRLTQRLVQPTAQSQDNPLSRKSVTKWNLEESEVDFTNLEIRTFSSGFNLDVDDNMDPHKNSPTGASNEEHVIESEWQMDEDMQYSENNVAVKLHPFITSPKLSYYRRNQDSSKAEEQEHLKVIGN